MLPTNISHISMDCIIVPSGYVKIAIENDHRNSEFSHTKNCDFP